MEGVDKEHVKRVVYEMSKGSAHFANEQRKQAALEEKIQNMKVGRTGGCVCAHLYAHGMCVSVCGVHVHIFLCAQLRIHVCVRACV